MDTDSVEKTSFIHFMKAIEEYQSALDYARLGYRSANQFNPVIPLWFDRALERGVKFDLEKRYSILKRSTQSKSRLPA